MFVDADDVAVSQAAELLLRPLEETRSDFASGRVERLAGRLTWPSAMHERALARPSRETHITRDPSLLYDSTTWNKLFRLDFWRANRLQFPASVLFEDVPLMVEAHCRASSVDVISDVVYRWRRREDGILSITQKRDDLFALDERVRSMRQIRELLNRLAPCELRHAGEVKFLVNDLGQYLNDLPNARAGFRHHFVELTRDFLQASPTLVRAQLTPVQRTAYHLIEVGDVESLLEFLRYSARMGGALPLRRRGFSLHVDVGPAAAITPSRLTNTRRRVPLTVGVDALRWTDHQLEIDGYGFLRGIPHRHPSVAIRRLKIVQRSTGHSRSVWLAPRVNRAAATRHGDHRQSHLWSGFQARVPLSVFDLPPGVWREQWDVYLQALGIGVAGGSSVGPPRSGVAWFPGTAHRRDGVSLYARWGARNRLVINARRLRNIITGVGYSEGRLTLAIAALDGDPCHPRQLDLIRSTSREGATPVPVTWACAADHRGCIGTAAVDPHLVVQTPDDRPYVASRLVEATEDGPLPVGISLRQESSFAVGAQTLLVRDDGSGRAELVATPPRVAVDRVQWVDDRLRVEGFCSLPEGARPDLAFRCGTGQTIYGVESRTTDRFRSEFELRRIPGPHGAHVLPTATWQLVRPLDGLDWLPVVASRGHQAGVEAAKLPTELMVKLWVNRHSEITLQAFANVEAARGAGSQARLRKRTYAAARRSQPVSQILVECWQGKQYSDNPRALVESMHDAGIDLPIAVAVRDRSIVTPPIAKPVVRWSREYWELLGSARLIIANDLLTAHYRKSPQQLLLQTWHGTPLKKVGFDIERVHFRDKNYLDRLRAETVAWDWLISPNPHSTRTLRRAFDFAGPILETGYPRNDLLAGPNDAERDAARARARRWFGTDPETTVALWMPTFRDDAHLPGGGYGAPVTIDIEALVAGLPSDTTIWLRGHHLMDQAFARMGDRRQRLRIVSSYPDVRELLLAADILITDYSSVMFDFALTGKPMILFMPDLARYRDDIRGFYLDPLTIAPGPVVHTVGELIVALADREQDATVFGSRYAAFRSRFGSLEDGRAGRRVWEEIGAAL